MRVRVRHHVQVVDLDGAVVARSLQHLERGESLRGRGGAPREREDLLEVRNVHLERGDEDAQVRLALVEEQLDEALARREGPLWRRVRARAVGEDVHDEAQDALLLELDAGVVLDDDAGAPRP